MSRPLFRLTVNTKGFTLWRSQKIPNVSQKSLDFKYTPKHKLSVKVCEFSPDWALFASLCWERKKALMWPTVFLGWTFDTNIYPRREPTRERTYSKYSSTHKSLMLSNTLTSPFQLCIRIASPYSTTVCGWNWKS